MTQTKPLKQIQNHYLPKKDFSGYIESLERHYIHQDERRRALYKELVERKLEIKDLRFKLRIAKRAIKKLERKQNIGR